MSWQKCMSFSKCFNLEAETVIDFKLCHRRDKKGRTIISDKQSLENKAFLMGFMHLKIKIKEKFKLKTKLNRQKFKYQFYTTFAESFQLPKSSKFLKVVHWLWRYNVWRKRPFSTVLKSQKDVKRGA